MQRVNTKPDGVFAKRTAFAVLLLFLCVLGLRLTYPENTQVAIMSSTQSLGNDAISLILSAVLIIVSLAWITAKLCSPSVTWRVTWMEVGVAMFAAAGIVAVFFASNKRNAITDLVTMLGPMIAAVVLLQILDGMKKIRLVLMVIVALSAVCTYQCADQFFSANQMMIDQYEENPEEQLGMFGIEPDSFKHRAYEHRLYSKDVRGFFTTGNSAGSFFLLAIFACLALVLTDETKKGESFRKRALLYAVAGGVCIFGLVLTRSKGAIAAGLVAATLALILWLFGGWLRRHWRIVLVVCLIGAAAVVWVVVSYGTEHERLPGGNSMLVRWQYWTSAWKMYAAKPFTGVGAGNFGSYYTHYKIASAPETVKDPHCFVLSILAQYGPVALAGFAAAVTMLALAAIRGGRSKTDEDTKIQKTHLALTGTAVAVCLLVFRPLLITTAGSDDIAVMFYVVLFLFIVPVIFFVIMFLLLYKAEEISAPGLDLRNGRIAIFCGIFAVMLHNLVDFAIFEPGVLTTFWVMAAALAAMGFSNTDKRLKVWIPPASAKIASLAVCAALIFAFLNFSFIPTFRASRLRQAAIIRPDQGHRLLDLASRADRLNAEVKNLNGRFYVRHWEETGKRQPQLLEEAKDCFTEAISRDPANFSNYENLRQAYEKLAGVSAPDTKKTWLQKADDTGRQATDRYPGSGRLWYARGEIAEKLGNDNQAADHFAQVVSIEDSYRRQFEVMYPGRNMVSRLGEKKYNYAKKKAATPKAR